MTNQHVKHILMIRSESFINMCLQFLTIPHSRLRLLQNSPSRDFLHVFRPQSCMCGRNCNSDKLIDL